MSGFVNVTEENKTDVRQELNKNGGRILYYGNSCLDNPLLIGGYLSLFARPKIDRKWMLKMSEASDRRSREYIIKRIQRTDIGYCLEFANGHFYFEPDTQHTISRPLFMFSGQKALYVPRGMKLNEPFEFALEQVFNEINEARVKGKAKSLTGLGWDFPEIGQEDIEAIMDFVIDDLRNGTTLKVHAGDPEFSISYCREVVF